jgi:hypothetical protein
MPPCVAIVPSAPESGTSTSAVIVHDLLRTRGDASGGSPTWPA